MAYQFENSKVIGFLVRVALFLALLVSVGQLSRVTVYASWTEPEQVSNIPGGGLAAPIMLAADDSGILHAVWIQYKYNPGDQDGTFYAQKLPGQAWSLPESVPLPFRGDHGKMDALVSPNGTVHLVASGTCCGSDWAWVYLSRSPSGQWSEVELANTGYAAAGGPSLVLDSTGTLHLVYAGKLFGTFDPPQMRYQYKTPGASWSGMQQISSGAGDAIEGILAVDDTDTLHLAWTQDMDGDHNFQAVYSTLVPGGSWSSFEPIYDGASVRSFVVDSSFLPHLVFFDSARNFDLSYTYRSGSGQWSSPLDLTDAPGVNTPSLTVAANGTLHLVFDDEHGLVKYRIKPAGAPWSDTSIAATYTTQSGFVWPRVTTDGVGRSHIVFGNSNIYYITQLNQPPVANAGADVVTAVNTPVALDGSGSFDPDNDPISYLWTEEVSNPQLNVLTSTSVANPAFTPSIAGIYIFNLVVDDGSLSSAPDIVVVTVQTPSEVIQDLIDVVEGYNLQQGIDNSLDAKLNSALQALNDINENNDGAAINSLQAFINAVEAQRGNTITDEQANELVSLAQNIIASLSSF